MLAARRLVERGVRFVQVYPSPYGVWDSHRALKKNHAAQTAKIDKPGAGLLKDLKRRGLYDDVLVVFCTEFGRTPAVEERSGGTDGRDHHPRWFSMWMAGGGVRAGTTYGATDDFSYNVAENGVHVHDLNATLLYCLGIDHRRLTFKYQGRHHRLTDVHGRVVEPLLA